MLSLTNIPVSLLLYWRDRSFAIYNICKHNEDKFLPIGHIGPYAGIEISYRHSDGKYHNMTIERYNDHLSSVYSCHSYDITDVSIGDHPGDRLMISRGSCRLIFDNESAGALDEHLINYVNTGRQFLNDKIDFDIRPTGHLSKYVPSYVPAMGWIPVIAYHYDLAETEGLVYGCPGVIWGNC